MKDDFDIRNRQAWGQAVASLGLGEVQSATWRGAIPIMEALRPFLGTNLGHTHLPTGGGHSFDSVRISPEHGCIEFGLGGDSWHLVKPADLTIEQFPDDPVETFLMLELAPIGITDAYDDEERTSFNEQFGQEEVVRLPSGEYIPRDYWDDRIIIGENGDEPTPEGATLTIRWLRGRMLFVAKRSLWNRSRKTYRGLHNGLNTGQVRQLIEGRRELV